MNTQENFVQVLVDCRGYSRSEALETADEYCNDLKSYLKQGGADSNDIEECKAFLGLPNKAI